MYRQWAVVNIFMMSYLHLAQGSSYEHGTVKAHHSLIEQAALALDLQRGHPEEDTYSSYHCYINKTHHHCCPYNPVRKTNTKQRASRSTLERSEQQIRAASGLEELLRITHFEDWKLWRCRLKLPSLTGTDSRSASHRATRFAATFYDLETLKVIDEEWQRTQCSPRETCVEVASELGRSTDTFFKPPCVNVFRCGGCCNEESRVCMNTSTSYISKQLFQISVPLTSVPELVPVKVANHTGCKCLPTAPHHPYSIIRRSIQVPEEDHCSHSKKLCPIDMLWDSNKCKCVLREENPLVGMEEHSHLQELAVCGPHMKFDEDRCECVCKTPCPRDLIQHPENCSCIECRESLESCCQKHKIFHPDTCSCEDRCPFHTRTCANGKPACAKHCRFPKEKRAAHGLHGQENP